MVQSRKPKSESSIELKSIFGAINRKDRSWWETLSTAQQDKFSSWLYGRYISSSKSNNPDIQRYFSMATNKAVNCNFGVLHRNHKKLQFLLMTTIPSPAYGIIGDFQYIKPIPQTKRQDKTMKILMKLLPDEKIDDLETLSDLIDSKELKQMMMDQGWDEKSIKKELK